MRFGDSTGEDGEGKESWWERHKTAILAMPFTIKEMRERLLPEPGTTRGVLDAEVRRVTSFRSPGWHDEKKAKLRLLFDKLIANFAEDKPVTLNDLAPHAKAYFAEGISWRTLNAFVEEVTEIFISRNRDIAKQIHDDANFVTYYNELGEGFDEQESELDIQVREVIFSAWISGLITEEWGI